MDKKATMELVADLKFMLKSSNAWDQLRNFGFIQEVTGKNGKHLKYITESSNAIVTMKPRNVNIKEGLSFTIRHENLDEVREAAGLLHSLLGKVQCDFQEYLVSRKISKNIVQFEMETSKAWCGLCKQSFTTLFDLEDHIDEQHNKPQKTESKDTSEAEERNTLQTATSDTYTAWPVKNKNEELDTSASGKLQETVTTKVDTTPAVNPQMSVLEAGLKRKLPPDGGESEEPPAKIAEQSAEPEVPKKEVDDPDLRKGFLQDSLRKRENNEMDDIQTLMIINRIKRKLNYKEKEDISSRVANIVKYMNMRREAGSKVDSTELLTVNLKVSVKIVAQKLNYDMSVPAETPEENNGPAAAQGQTAATSGQSTPPQSPSVAPNTPPKYKSSSIAIKLSYNQPQSSQDKPNEPESGKQFSQVLSVPNPLERATPLTHSRSASSLAEVKKLNLPVTAAIRKSTQPQNGKISKQDQKAQQFDSKLSHLKDKVPAFLEICAAGSVEEDMTETIDKLKGILSEEDRVAVGKSFNREINLWQVKVKKKIPPPIKQGLHLKVTWNKCEETLTSCAKDAKADFIDILDSMLKCIGQQGHGDEAENNSEDEEVKIDWSRKLAELKKKIDSFLDHCLSEDDVTYDLSDKISKLNDLLTKEDQDAITKAMNRQINVLQQKEKKKINFSTRQALQLKVVWNTCYKKLSHCATEMNSEYRDVVNYTLQWVDKWYFDGKAPDIPEEKGIAALASEWTFQSAISNMSNSSAPNGSEDLADKKNMTYIEKQLEELNERLDPFLRECYVGRGPDLVPTVRKLENKLTPVQKENIEVELNKEATESEKKLKRHLKDCERDVLHLRILWKSIYEYLKIGAKGNNPECRGMIVSLLLWVKSENKSIESDAKESKKETDTDWLDETSDSKDMSTIPSHLDKDLKEHLILRESGKLTNGKTLSVIRTLKQNLSPQEKGEIGKLITTAHNEEAKLKGSLDASEKISIHLRVTCDFIQNRRRRALVNFR